MMKEVLKNGLNKNLQTWVQVTKETTGFRPKEMNVEGRYDMYPYKSES